MSYSYLCQKIKKRHAKRDDEQKVEEKIKHNFLQIITILNSSLVTLDAIFYINLIN